MNKLTTSPFFRPLTITVGIMLFYYARETDRGNFVGLPKFLLIGAWFLSGAVIMSFAQIIRNKEFGWLASFLGVIGLGIAMALLMLGLKKLGLIYQ